MNSPKLPATLPSAPDALFDDLEHELLALTIASLDDELLSAPPVDEFADEFLVELSRPPCAPPPRQASRG
jgi:hypothetical protein